jgi:hypothetical protein
VLAVFGELHLSTLEALDIEGPLAVSEVILDRIPAAKAKASKAKPALAPSPFQPVLRDFAFVVDRGVAAAEIIYAAKGADKALVASVDVFDLYEGKEIEAGKKSIAIAVTLQPREKTLTDAEIDAVAGKSSRKSRNGTGAVLPCLRRRARSRGEDKVGEGKALALHDIADLRRNGAAEHGPRENAGVKLTALAAGIDACRELIEQRRVELPPGEGFRHHLEIDADQMRLQPALDHGARERGGRPTP